MHGILASVRQLNLKAETLAAAFLVAFGLLALPAMIYFVGQQVVGEYEGEGGIWTLYGAIFGSLGRMETATWVLVLSPYLVVLLIRLLAVLTRRKKPVKRVTE